MEATASDLVELKRLLSHGSTPYVEHFLKAEIAALESKLTTQEEHVEHAEVSQIPRKTYQSIDSYAFSDSNDKAAIIIHNVEGLENSEVIFKPEDHSCTIYVIRESQNLPNLKLTISPLYKKIIPQDSKYTKKKETLTVILAKKKSSSWMKLKKSSLDAKKPKSPNDKEKIKEDPNGALMDMIKKMYDEGDDEMKRTISKAMWEAQHKNPDEKKIEDE